MGTNPPFEREFLSIEKGKWIVECRVESQNPDEVKVDVTLDADEIDRRFKATYRDFARRYRFPGFRAGRAPRPVINNAVGAETVAASVAEDAINETYPLVIEQERLYPLGQPSFDQENLPTEGAPFDFSFTVSVTPQVELTSYEPPAIELPPAGASEPEIDEQIDGLRRHYATFEDASEDVTLAEGLHGDFSIEATDAEGNAIGALSSDSRLYGPGMGLFSAAFDNEIIGMKAGETREFDLAVAEDEKALLLSDYAGQTLHFKVTCEAVKERKEPELTDEWVKDTLHFDTVDELRGEVASSIEAQKAEVIPRLKERAIVTELIDRVDAEPPEAMVEEQESNLLQDFFSQLQRQSMTFDTYLMQAGLTSDQFKEDIKKQARDETLRGLALDAWARAKSIEATDEDVTAEFEKAGLEDAAAVEAEWKKNGRLYLIRQEIVREKALKDLEDSAVVTEVDPLTLPEEEAPADEAAEVEIADEETIEE